MSDSQRTACVLVVISDRNLPVAAREAQVFILSRFSGLSNKEIAQQTGLTVRTVESYVTSALKILRTVLKDYLFFLLMII